MSKTEWIPVSEMIPDIIHFEDYSPGDELDPETEYYVSDWVLVTFIDKSNNNAICVAHMWHEAKADSYGWEDTDRYDALENVLAWMPLPEPYKEDNK